MCSGNRIEPTTGMRAAIAESVVSTVVTVNYEYPFRAGWTLKTDGTAGLFQFRRPIEIDHNPPFSARPAAFVGRLPGGRSAE
jgi:hypothetical protein